MVGAGLFARYVELLLLMANATKELLPILLIFDKPQFPYSLPTPISSVEHKPKHAIDR